MKIYDEMNNDSPLTISRPDAYPNDSFSLFFQMSQFLLEIPDDLLRLDVARRKDR